MSHRALTPEQQAEVDRLQELLMSTVAQEVRAIAGLLASKPDNQLLGQMQFR